VFIAIITTGGFSPWFPYTLASIYHAVDKIVVTNGGYNWDTPREEVYNVPSERITKYIKQLDIRGKVVELRNWTVNDLKCKMVFMTQKKANEIRDRIGKEPVWGDIRSVGLQLSFEKAFELGASKILRIDDDQIVYPEEAKLLRELPPVLCYQYELVGSYPWRMSDPPPATPWNDAPYTFNVTGLERVVHGGSACSASSSRVYTDKVHALHLRYANPIDATDEEKYEHFYKRCLFRLYTNVFGKINNRLIEQASMEAKSLLGFKGKPLSISLPRILYISRNGLKEFLRR